MQVMYFMQVMGHSGHVCIECHAEYEGAGQMFEQQHFRSCQWEVGGAMQEKALQEL
jgi:hypothetical protein